MEKKTDLFNELVDDLQIKTKEYLQVPFYDILSVGPYFRKARWPPCIYVTVAKMNVADHCMPIFSSHWNISAQSYGPSKDGSSQGGFHF